MSLSKMLNKNRNNLRILNHFKYASYESISL